MTATDAAGAAACPGCALPRPELKEIAPRLRLSLPGIHCAACISGVERTLLAVPGVVAARVNLTRRQVAVEAGAGVSAEDLVAALGRAGYEALELDPAALAAGGDAARDLLMRLAVAGFAMMNVMLLSVAVWSGASDATRDLFHWISAAIALPTVAFSAQPFFRSALSALAAVRLNMDVPISLAILLATGLSLMETWVGGETAWFDAALSLTFFLLAGRYLDQRARASARSAAAELTALEVPRATRADGRVVPVADLRPGDLIRVLPGQRVPADGTVETGASEIDRSLLTGETLPEPAAPGDPLASGEVNLTGALVMRVTAAGKDSSLRRLADLVAVAEGARGRYASLADRAARVYAPVVHLLALAAFVGWLAATGDWRLAANIAVAVLIITCPCALGLAVPAVSTAASGRLFRKGLLVKDATAFERLAEADVAVFDKTGTLTEGVPVLAGHDGSELDAAVARALAEGSSHPLARALCDAVPPSSETLSEAREVPGFGVKALWRGLPVRLGRAGWVGATPEAETSTFLRIGDADPVAFRFHDRPRPGAEAAVSGLERAGLEIRLLSGDATAPTEKLAAALGIGSWRAAMRPEDKAAEVEALAERGHLVLMVGDGLNDTAALARAHVSVSPASALDAARAVSDVVLLGRDLSPVADAVTTARQARRRILENFAIAATYNAVAVPLALAGVATPLMAAVAMSTSSILVTLNALRLR